MSAVIGPLQTLRVLPKEGAVDQVNAIERVCPAPCVAAPMDVLRHLVSGDKYRFKDPTTGTDLDLTYITERIIAMVRP